MNRYNLFIGLLFFLSPLFGQAEKVNQLHSSELHSLLEKEQINLIDVRTPSEFSNGHLQDAGQLNFYALDFKKNLLLLPKDKPVYLYCNTGYRSQKAAEFLVKNGYDQVYNLERGIMEWEMLDLTVIVEPDARPDTKHKMESDEYYALLNSDRPVFIDFYAPWCGPCRQMMPMIDSLKTAYAGKIDVVKINADASKKLIKELEVWSVPYFRMFHNGNEIFTHAGMLQEEKVTGLFESMLY